MSTQAVREYLMLIWQTYKFLARVEKGKVLDEVIRNLGITRKSAIRLLNSPHPPRSKHGFLGGRPRCYSEEAKRHLEKLWTLMGYMCATRMKAALPEWIEFYSASGFTPAIKSELLQMSESSIKRFLETARKDLARRMNSGTRRGPRSFVTKIPFRNFDAKPLELGHVELDLVGHHGTSMSGTFAWTLTATDTVSGWTEVEAVWGKDAEKVVLALEKMESRFPFPLKAIYTDNGSEFMNRYMVEFCQKGRLTPIQHFRGRPYRKNDQALVEQKNYTHVRQIFGYGRLDWFQSVRQMNDIYRKEWRLLQNYYMPQQRLEAKWREFSKRKRRMGSASTPFSRLKALLPAEEMEALAKEKEKLDPIRLRISQRTKTRQMLNYYQNRNQQVSKGRMAV